MLLGISEVGIVLLFRPSWFKVARRHPIRLSKEYSIGYQALCANYWLNDGELRVNRLGVQLIQKDDSICYLAVIAAPSNKSPIIFGNLWLEFGVQLFQKSSVLKPSFLDTQVFLDAPSTANHDSTIAIRSSVKAGYLFTPKSDRR